MQLPYFLWSREASALRVPHYPILCASLAASEHFSPHPTLGSGGDAVVRIIASKLFEVFALFMADCSGFPSQYV